MKESGDRLLLLRNTVQENRLVGVARLRYLAPDELFAVLGQVSLADQVRRHTYGEILLISGIYVERDPMINDAEQLLLTEAIARSFEYKCGYALFFPADGYARSACCRRWSAGLCEGAGPRKTRHSIWSICMRRLY